MCVGFRLRIRIVFKIYIFCQPLIHLRINHSDVLGPEGPVLLPQPGDVDFLCLETGLGQVALQVLLVLYTVWNEKLTIELR